MVMRLPTPFRVRHLGMRQGLDFQMAPAAGQLHQRCRLPFPMQTELISGQTALMPRNFRKVLLQPP